MFDDETVFKPYEPEEDRLTSDELRELLRQMVQDGELRTYFDSDSKKTIYFKPGVTKPNPKDLRRN